MQYDALSHATGVAVNESHCHNMNRRFLFPSTLPE